MRDFRWTVIVSGFGGRRNGERGYSLFLWVLVILATSAGARPQSATNPFHDVGGLLQESPFEKLGIGQDDLAGRTDGEHIQYVGMTRYLNGTKAVVTATIDDSTEYVDDAVDAFDKYGIRATVAISTQRGPISDLWPRLQRAVENGHEIASHSRRHQCQWPDTQEFCRRAYGQDEVTGSKNDILANTSQPHVSTWVYPCGNCAGYEFVHRRLQEAGYLVARNYPDERRGGVLVPDLQSWALDPYSAAFTQVVQKKGGIAPAGRTDVPSLNAKFDEVYQNGGIYHFVSHPQWLDYGPDSFFEKHLAYLGGRNDVWYVPLGPLYAYQLVAENTVVSRLKSTNGLERFVVYNRLDPQIYRNSVTLEFKLSSEGRVRVSVEGKDLPERASPEEVTDEWGADYYRVVDDSILVTMRPNSILEFEIDNE